MTAVRSPQAFPGSARPRPSPGTKTKEAASTDHVDENMIKDRYKLMAALIAAAGVLLIAYALLSTSSGAHSGMMGSQVTSRTYSLANMLLGIVGSFLTAGGLAFILLKEDYEPLPPNALPTMISEQVGPAQEPFAQTTPAPMANEEAPAIEAPAAIESCPVDERKLVLRLLTGDERTMFRAILDSGGEALQKDLIVKTKMSDAKVSRVLDRLVEKGVISKTRYGVTNKVRIEIEP